MTLADQVRHSVLSKETVARGKAFEYYYYQLKIMVESPTLMECGEVIHYNRAPLKGQRFSNKNCNSRWFVHTTSGREGTDKIHLTLMR